jgi:hypothetical protein
MGGHYLLGMEDKGLVLDPTLDLLDIKMYADTNFAGMHAYEHPESPT